MEKENKKKTSADRERRKKLTNAILMAFVCIMMMSGATYAWFTMSNTAKVTSMKLNVAAEGTLYIEKSEVEVSRKLKTAVTWFGDAGAADDTSTIQTLYPCTTDDGKTMKKPVYVSEKKVGSVVAIEENEEEMYYLEKDFYLLMDEGDNNNINNKTYDVCLVQKGDEALNKGTFFEAEYGGLCARVSFEVDGQPITVYEPNSEGTLSGTKAEADSTFNAFTSEHKQSTDGKFTKSDATTGDSDKLFTITGDTPTKVTIRVWFEGTDDQCCNEIALNQIEGQLKFMANKTTTP